MGFSEILDRITKLNKNNPSRYKETENWLIEIERKKFFLKNCMDLHKENLQKEIKERNLCTEKLRNAAMLGIDLPKFEGYSSPMDYYSFT